MNDNKLIRILLSAGYAVLGLLMFNDGSFFSGFFFWFLAVMCWALFNTEEY